MPYFSSDAKEFLDEIPAFLGEGPGDLNEKLSEIPSRLTDLVRNNDTDTAEQVVRLLGTAVGQQSEWQVPFRQAGILAYSVQQLDSTTTTPPALIKQYLRVIGNSVADNDENRQTVTEYLENLVACIKVVGATTTALGVILNLCNDFAPAQVEAAKLRLDNIITTCLVDDQIPEEATEYAAEVITWTTEKLSPAQLEDATSIQTVEHILKISLHCKDDNYHDYLAILVHFLQGPELQQKVATPEILSDIFALAEEYQSRLGFEETQIVFTLLRTQREPEKASSEDITVLLMVQLVNSLCAISATDTFIKNFNLKSPLIRKLLTGLVHAETPLTVSACVMLGNLATSDQVSIAMVEEGLHHNLLSRDESGILYAAAGLARHLAFPEVNRTKLGDSGLIETCCGLLTHQDPPLRGEAAAIIAKLVTNNLGNIRRVVNFPCPGDIQLYQLPGVKAPAHPTILYHLVTQALAPSGPVPSLSMKNATIELGRTIVAMLRYLGQIYENEDAKSIRLDMFEVPVIARAVSRLVRQRFFAEARSEGLLGLGLMAQTQQGATHVLEEMKADEGLLPAIKEVATEAKKEESKDRAPQGETAVARDYQNALVLLHGLLEKGHDATESHMRDDIAALQKDLGTFHT